MVSPPLAPLLAALAAASPARTLDEYRHFRALSVDLNGRIPTRAELAQFEAVGFDLEAWIDERLAGPAYAERMARIYLDALRLQVGSSYQFVPSIATLRRVQVKGPDGEPIWIYFRQGQRRGRIETDGVFCLTLAETGQHYPSYSAPTTPDGGAMLNVSQAVLDQYTALVFPWWLYADYQSASPSDRYDASTWAQRFPGFVPSPKLLSDQADGNSTMVQQIRVCKEEAQTAAEGAVVVTGRCTEPLASRPAWCSKSNPPPYGRMIKPPIDSAFAAAAGAAQKRGGAPLPRVDCSSLIGFNNSAECGCGPGLERCMPGAGHDSENPAFVFQRLNALGSDQPIDQAEQVASSWQRFWWGEEAAHFLTYLFSADRPLTEMLTARYGFVNGPLAQFHKSAARATCCDSPAIAMGLLEPEPLFDPKALPAGLAPQATGDWRRVEDRGSQAAGILTMPVFLTKYGSRRSRAHVLQQVFLCLDFTASGPGLKPSTEPNLMLREGCRDCHATLDPMAAYFARIQESDWTYLPARRIPLRYGGCRVNDAGVPANAPPEDGGLNVGCSSLYDPAFSDNDAGTLRDAYPDLPVAGQLDPFTGAPLAHADQGPAGLARELVHHGRFDACVSQRVAESFLRRALTREDAALRAALVSSFSSAGRTPKAMVKALLKSDAYLRANALSSASLRAVTP